MSTDLLNLEDQVAIVTGGSRGIGAGKANALAGAGAFVTIFGRDASSGVQTAKGSVSSSLTSILASHGQIRADPTE